MDPARLFLVEPIYGQGRASEVYEKTLTWGQNLRVLVHAGTQAGTYGKSLKTEFPDLKTRQE